MAVYLDHVVDAVELPTSTAWAEVWLLHHAEFSLSSLSSWSLCSMASANFLRVSQFCCLLFFGGRNSHSRWTSNLEQFSTTLAVLFTCKS